MGVFALTLVGTSYAAETPRFDRKALEAHVRYLASDELGGRGNGTDGLRLAARYVASEFEKLELSPAGESGTYFQTFRVMVGKKIGRWTEVSLRYPEGTQLLEVASDFQPMTFSSAGELSAPVVFAGYGVTAPEHDYDDYGNVDVEGKIVMLLRYVPGQSLEQGPFEKDGWHATFVRKAKNAVSHGARGIIFVNGLSYNREDRLIPFGVDVGTESIPVPAIHMRRENAEQFLRAAGASLGDLQRNIDDRLAPRSFELEGVFADIAIDVRRTIVEVSNVLAYLPPTTGNSPEHIVIGAHYDHLGLGGSGSRERQANGKIHNGADDNASGVAGVLELARVFRELENRPRGILFAAFAGEELGLRGSNYYTDNATFRLEDAVAMINLDMIGRLRHKRLFIGGADIVPSLRQTLDRLTGDEELTYSTRFSAETSSDHASFIRAGVPALFFFTGLHGDYHKPTDDLQFVNFEGMEQVLEVSYNLTDHLLRASKRPVLTPRRASGDGELVSRRAAERAYFGVGVDNNFKGEGALFSYVADGGPAAAAGLQAGDVLLELDGRAVVSGERAGAMIEQRRPGETVSAKIRRDNRILEVKIRLSQWP
ncbi:MAG: hypothetical protein BMS9Abin37_2383 [Acidobacteriota bacterium]|nr:MAG: hypothetical protein BMS9Abin37_2383 [Acidobacteriota bacterium]